MKRLLICGIQVLALLSVIGQAATNDVPMKGSGSGIITGVIPGPEPLVTISAHGEGEATHLGKFTREESIVLNTATGAATGTIVFTAADGSVLYCGFTGGFTGANTLGGTYTFTGGTGRFANAAGSASFVVTQSDMVNFTFEFSGTIDIN
jgi:hypothetical protein